LRIGVCGFSDWGLGIGDWGLGIEVLLNRADHCL
jgi:hypothetical protein